MTDLEVADGVAATARGPGGEAGGHDIGGDIARGHDAIGKLGDLAHGADGIHANLRSGARGHGGQKESHEHGNKAHPPVNGEEPDEQQRGHQTEPDKADDEPGHGNFQMIEDAFRRVLAIAETGENAGERTAEGAPLEGEREQATNDEHGGTGPERPGADIAEAADILQRRGTGFEAQSGHQGRRLVGGNGETGVPIRGAGGGEHQHVGLQGLV